MPYVDTTPALFTPKMTEGDFQTQFAALLKKYGWTFGQDGDSVVLQFKKAAKEVKQSGVSEQGTPMTDYVVANHTIFKNAKGSMFGLAVIASFSDADTEYPATEEAKVAYFEQKFSESKANTVLYYYMLEQLPTVENGQMKIVEYVGDLTQMALDVEVTGTTKRTDQITYKFVTDITEAQPSVMQSPIVRSEIRSKSLEPASSYPFQQTNWWSDSEIRLQGFIDDSTIFIIIQADNVPAWENNIIPTVPFYFGAIDPVDEGDAAVAMFAGTVPPGATVDTIGKYDFDDSTKKAGTKILPILKTYPNHPSNGIDSVMLSRSKFGSRYQEYFLSWNTAPNLMPPDRKSADGKEYPRAWNNLSNDEYKYQFNPSRYSGKVHTSKIYVIHPEEGIRGSLSKAIGLSSLNFNAGKLRIRKQNCPEKIYDVYRFYMVGSACPLTKRPATPFRSIGLGIFDSEYDPSQA